MDLWLRQLRSLIPVHHEQAFNEWVIRYVREIGFEYRITAMELEHFKGESHFKEMKIAQIKHELCKGLKEQLKDPEWISDPGYFYGERAQIRMSYLWTEAFK